MKNFESVNPFTEDIGPSWPFLKMAELEAAVSLAHKLQPEWAAKSIKERSDVFLRLANLIRRDVDMLARIATSEMGKLISEAKAEVLKCASICTWCAENAESVLAPRGHALENGRTATVTYEPVGIVLGVFPWNFPFWQVLRSAIPVLASGNCMLVKPAPNVPQSALALQAILDEAGFMPGVIQTIFATEEQVAGLIADDRIGACTLTGSGMAGSKVGSAAAGMIKKTVLELGGSDPFIVLADADIDLAAEKAVNARFQNNGQSCIAAKRFIVHHKVSGEFLNKLVARTSSLRMGNPASEGITIGPLARKDLREKLESQVKESVRMGAHLIYQATDIPAKGFFYPPTILGNIPHPSPAYKDELFGPVISYFTVNSEEEAIQLANDSMFGLGATIWSRNTESARKIAREVKAGQVFINEVLRSNAALPFGGVKASGFGREMGEEGIREFCNLKVISV